MSELDTRLEGLSTQAERGRLAVYGLLLQDPDTPSTITDLNVNVSKGVAALPPKVGQLPIQRDFDCGNGAGIITDAKSKPVAVVAAYVPVLNKIALYAVAGTEHDTPAAKSSSRDYYPTDTAIEAAIPATAPVYTVLGVAVFERSGSAVTQWYDHTARSYGVKIADKHLTGDELDNTDEALIADPGDAGAIPANRSGYCPLTSGGAETRTLAAPAKANQKLFIYMAVDGGDIVLTCATGFDEGGDTEETFANAGELLALYSVEATAGVYRWRRVDATSQALDDVTAKTDLITLASASGPASFELAEDTDNGSNKVTITPQEALGADRTFLLPDQDVAPLHGTGTIANGTTQDVISVGTDYNGKLAVVSFAESPGTAAKIWAGAVAGGNLTVNVDADPGTDVDFHYHIL